MGSRILPFAAYMAFIAIQSLAFPDETPVWLYPIQISFVSALLIFYRKDYLELKDKFVANVGEVLFAVGVGVLVYLAWVRMDFPWAMQGELGKAISLSKSAVALAFFMRYIVSPDFLSVKLGQFTRASFLITVLLFGVEHNLWLAGMMAGVAYNLVMYRTRRLWPCVIAHAVTNLMLGIHVLLTGQWYWW